MYDWWLLTTMYAWWLLTTMYAWWLLTTMYEWLLTTMYDWWLLTTQEYLVFPFPTSKHEIWKPSKVLIRVFCVGV
jgi:hypothetical protein